MEREIIFRGKRIDNGEWVEGDLLTRRNAVSNESAIIFFDDEHIIPRSPAVDFETVGQYTGLKDKNGLNKIFEYDIINKNGKKVGNYYEDKNLLETTTNMLIERMGTKKWSRTEQEAIKRGCKYAQ